MKKLNETDLFENPKDRKFLYNIIRTAIPQLIVNNNLDSLYIKNQKLCEKKILNILKTCEDGSDLESIVHVDFVLEKYKLIKFMKNLEDDQIEKLSHMFLFYSVSIFEQMCNKYIYEELNINYKIDLKTINEKILRNLRTEDKIGWFLQIINGHNFLKEKSSTWTVIKNGIDHRNFFMHYKPERGETYSKYKKVNRKFIYEFLNNSIKCYKFLVSVRGIRSKDYNKKLTLITKLFDERNKNFYITKPNKKQ